MKRKTILHAFSKSDLWSILSPVITVFFILGTSIAVILYARGYRLNLQGEKQPIVTSTGILATTSDPSGAQIFINGVFKNATNTSLSLEPGTYTVKIAKDGYLSWQKDIRIDKEVVRRADAFLFPINPSISPLTNRGVIKPTLSPDGSKIAYISSIKNEGAKKQGYAIWVYELTDRALGFNRDPREIGAINPELSVDVITLEWSPNSNEILLFTDTIAILYSVGRTNEQRIVTNQLETIRKAWQEERNEKQLRQLSSFPKEFITIAKSSASILSFSPDETKVLYEATQSATLPLFIMPPVIGANSIAEERTLQTGTLYVYDMKEDKNYRLLDRTELLPSPSPSPSPLQKKQISPNEAKQKTLHQQTHYPIYWFPTNRHLILVMERKIDILEYDRTNWVTIYEGPLEDKFVAPWPGGNRIIIVSNFNPNASPLPNLFSVHLR